MMSKKIDDLSGAELDFWVAKAQGLNLIGQALCNRDPETGDYYVNPEQRSGELRWCHSIDDGTMTFQEIVEVFPRVAEVNGIPAILLLPIEEYSTRWGSGGQIIERDHIDLEYDEIGRCWIASMYPWKSGVSEPIGMCGETALIAACRVNVASVYGEKVPDA